MNASSCACNIIRKPIPGLIKLVNPSVLSWCYSTAINAEQGTAPSNSCIKVSAPVNITAPFASLLYIYSIEGNSQP